MDLKIKDRLFIVTGATSGFGYAISQTLLEEGANIIINGRRKEIIDRITESYQDQITGATGDITNPETIKAVAELANGKKIDGLVINAGGPVAGSFWEVALEEWDNSYNLLIRWKVYLLKEFLPLMETQHYGRILFIESVSVKQPVDNLILSNSLRMAIVGLAKSLANEYAGKGITINVLAPGYHDTPALERIIKKRREINSITFEQARQGIINEIPVRRLGDPRELASFAAWLLSPLAGYVTGQTFSVEGGIIKSS